MSSNFQRDTPPKYFPSYETAPPPPPHTHTHYHHHHHEDERQFDQGFGAKCSRATFTSERSPDFLIVPKMFLFLAQVRHVFRFKHILFPVNTIIICIQIRHAYKRLGSLFFVVVFFCCCCFFFFFFLSMIKGKGVRTEEGCQLKPFDSKFPFHGNVG